jgi:hypothetical protein
MFVVSDTNTPYYNQIYSTNISPKYRVSELTLDILIKFSLAFGSTITLSLDNRNEYIKVLNLIQQSNYTRQITIIEFDNYDLFVPLFSKLSSIIATSSGVGISSDTNNYPDLNPYTLYLNITPVILILQYKNWESFIRDKVISNTNPNFNINDVYDIIKR